MNISQIVLKARASVIRWKLRRLELQRRRTVAEFMLAVDYGRHSAQDLYFQRGLYIAERKVALEAKLRQIKKEIV
jgi:hypothetical protein